MQARVGVVHAALHMHLSFVVMQFARCGLATLQMLLAAAACIFEGTGCSGVWNALWQASYVVVRFC
jgi:hypothetical protein